ncbi:MAG: hypothetical protein J5955_06560 [Bacilli bacterium]|nr:hypothetical protein [Bacilli bacterium]
MNSIQDKILIRLNKNRKLENDEAFCNELAASLHTFYIHTDNYEKQIMEIIGKSELDKNCTLMPMQLKMLNFIESNCNVVLSAPTSFGKSFVALEYIKRNQLNAKLIIYIVHTKALCFEIYDKCKRYLGDCFNVIDDFASYDPNDHNLLVFISDGININEYIKDVNDIDLLVVDEAYNLNKTNSNERFLAIYDCCTLLMNKAKKIILIGPFIKCIKDKTNNNYGFKLFKTNYSPVTSSIKEGDELTGDAIDTFIDCVRKNESTIGFINDKTYIYKTMDTIVNDYNLPDVHTSPFLIWMEKTFPSFWILPKVLKKGIAVYHSSFPKYLNYYNMHLFNDRKIMGLFTTSSILEGVNTSAKNIVIFSTSSGSHNSSLTPFQFFNLCGRAGRLGEEIVGEIYNFGDCYQNQYEQKSLPLIIGVESPDEHDDFNLDHNSNPAIKAEITRILSSIGLNFEPWYDDNKHYFKHDYVVLTNHYDAYIVFRERFKKDFEEKNIETLFKTSNKGEVDKNKFVNYVYMNFIVPSGMAFKYLSHTQTSKIIADLMISAYNGLTFKMSKVCNSNSINYYLSKCKNDIEKNKLIVNIMRIGYDYMTFDYKNSNILLRSFIENDNYLEETEKNIIKEYYLDRVDRYLKNSKDDRLDNYLIEKGLVPSLIEKIKNKLKENEINYSEMSNKELMNHVIDVLNNKLVKLEDFEIINIADAKLLEYKR